MDQHDKSLDQSLNQQCTEDITLIRQIIVEAATVHRNIPDHYVLPFLQIVKEEILFLKHLKSIGMVIPVLSILRGMKDNSDAYGIHRCFECSRSLCNTVVVLKNQSQAFLCQTCCTVSTVQDIVIRSKANKSNSKTGKKKPKRRPKRKKAKTSKSKSGKNQPIVRAVEEVNEPISVAFLLTECKVEMHFMSLTFMHDKVLELRGWFNVNRSDGDQGPFFDLIREEVESTLVLFQVS